MARLVSCPETLHVGRYPHVAPPIDFGALQVYVEVVAEVSKLLAHLGHERRFLQVLRHRRSSHLALNWTQRKFVQFCMRVCLSFGAQLLRRLVDRTLELIQSFVHLLSVKRSQHQTGLRGLKAVVL